MTNTSIMRATRLEAIRPLTNNERRASWASRYYLLDQDAIQCANDDDGAHDETTTPRGAESPQGIGRTK